MNLNRTFFSLQKLKSLAIAAKVSKKIPGNETLTLIKGVSKKVAQPSKKEVLKPSTVITEEIKKEDRKGITNITGHKSI